MRQGARITPRAPLFPARHFGVLGATAAHDLAPRGRRGRAELVFREPPAALQQIVLHGGDSRMTLAPHFSALLKWFVSGTRTLRLIERGHPAGARTLRQAGPLHTTRRMENIRNTTERVLVRGPSSFAQGIDVSFKRTPTPAARTRVDRVRRKIGHAFEIGADDASEAVRHRTILDVRTRGSRELTSALKHRLERRIIARAMIRADRTLRRLFARTERHAERHVHTSEVVERHLAARAVHGATPAEIAPRAPATSGRARHPAATMFPKQRRVPAAPEQHSVVPNRAVPPTELVFRTPETPPAPPPVPASATRPRVPAAPTVDIERLDTELWRRFEKRIRIEQTRRGRH